MFNTHFFTLGSERHFKKYYNITLSKKSIKLITDYKLLYWIMLQRIWYIIRIALSNSMTDTKWAFKLFLIRSIQTHSKYQSNKGLIEHVETKKQIE